MKYKKINFFDVESVTTEHPKTITKHERQKLLFSNQTKWKFIPIQKPLIVRYNSKLLKDIFILKIVYNVMKPKS